MGFQTIKRSPFGARGASAEPLMLSVTTNDSGHRCRVSFLPSLAAGLGFTAGTLLEVAIGDGPDTGWLRLREGAAGYKLAHGCRGGGRLVVSFPGTDDLPLTARLAAALAVKPQADRSVLIQMPTDWFALKAAAE